MKTKHLLGGLSAMLFALSPCFAKDPTILELQKKLAAAGFDPKGIDGNWGPGTESALKAYQAANNLPQTGRIEPGSDTAKKLELTVKTPDAQNQQQIPSSESSEKLKPGWGVFRGRINLQTMNLSDGKVEINPFGGHTAEGQIQYMDLNGNVDTFIVTGINVEYDEETGKKTFELFNKRSQDSPVDSMLLTSFDIRKNAGYYFGKMKPAQEPEGPSTQRVQRQPPAGVIALYDKDKDGKLSDEEITAMRADMTATVTVPVPQDQKQSSENSPQTTLWESATSSLDISKVKNYLEKYPNGKHADDAKALIDDESTITDIEINGVGSRTLIARKFWPEIIEKSLIENTQRGRSILDASQNIMKGTTILGEAIMKRTLWYKDTGAMEKGDVEIQAVGPFYPCGDRSVFILNGKINNILGDPKDPIRLLYSLKRGLVVIGGKGTIFGSDGKPMSEQMVFAEVAIEQKEPYVDSAAVDILTDQAALGKVAEHAESPWVRIAAISKLTDVALLKKIEASAYLEIIRDEARKRLISLHNEAPDTANSTPKPAKVGQRAE
jgi:peptidoglycan hydrolase-like protein with peptidoglycan-binding domain